MKNSWFIALLILASHSTGVQAQAPSIPWFTLDAGGGAGQAGAFVLQGTVGQPDGAAPVTGGAFAVTGGFWADRATTPAPRLSIRLDGAHTVVLAWPDIAPDVVLQQAGEVTASNSNGGWSDVPQTPSIVGSSREVRLPAADAPRFFRLHSR